MQIFEILVSTFLILWIIIGVGAILLLLRFRKVIQQLEKTLKDFVEGLNDFSGVLKSVTNNKEIIIGGVTLLAFLKRLFGNRKRK